MRTQEHQRISSFIPQNIRIGARFRTVKEEAIQAMMVSIQQVGLRTPITVRETADAELLLVAGCCRLQAILRLGWTDILAFVVFDDATENDVRLWEIAENLHRQDLTAQERAEHVAEWVKRTDGKDQSAQLGPFESKRSDGKGHRKEGGINAAVRDLGITRQEGQRSVKIANMQPEAKEAAREHGLDDNQSALLAVANAPPDQQVAKVREIADQKAARNAGIQPPRGQAPNPVPDTSPPGLASTSILPAIIARHSGQESEWVPSIVAEQVLFALRDLDIYAEHVDEEPGTPTQAIVSAFGGRVYVRQLFEWFDARRDGKIAGARRRAPCQPRRSSRFRNCQVEELPGMLASHGSGRAFRRLTSDLGKIKNFRIELDIYE